MIKNCTFFSSLVIICYVNVSTRQAAEFWRVYQNFRRHHLRNSPQSLNRLHELLYAYGNASATGIINKRRRWDFSGSFHFVGTIVSTIGKPLIRKNKYLHRTIVHSSFTSGFKFLCLKTRSRPWYLLELFFAR